MTCGLIQADLDEATHGLVRIMAQQSIVPAHGLLGIMTQQSILSNSD